MARNKKTLSQHDAEVRRIAIQLKNQGYDVRADLNGFPQPDAIRGVRPDIDATKG